MINKKNQNPNKQHQNYKKHKKQTPTQKNNTSKTIKKNQNKNKNKKSIFFLKHIRINQKIYNSIIIKTEKKKMEKILADCGKLE